MQRALFGQQASASRLGVRVRIERPVRPIHAREDRLERVVFALRDGIKLVIVATRAVDREALKCSERRAHHVVAIQVLRRAVIHRVLAHRDHQCVVPRPGGEETQRDRGLRVVGKQGVAGQLLLHKARVGLVLVQRADDVVPIMPRVRARVVVVVAVRVRVVRDVEPMPRPVLAVPRRSEQARDEFLVGTPVLVRDERGHLLGRGRQAGEVVAESPDERAAIGFGRWSEVFFLQLRADESINWIRFAARHGGLDQRRERPVWFRILR